MFCGGPLGPDALMKGSDEALGIVGEDLILEKNLYLLLLLLLSLLL